MFIAEMNIAETRWFVLGQYRVLQRPLASAPHLALYLVHKANALMGKMLSCPSLTDCEYLERHSQALPLRWAENGEQNRARLRGVAKRKKI